MSEHKVSCQQVLHETTPTLSLLAWSNPIGRNSRWHDVESSLRFGNAAGTWGIFGRVTAVAEVKPHTPHRQAICVCWHSRESEARYGEMAVHILDLLFFSFLFDDAECC